MSFGDWLTETESLKGPFRVIVRWGPNRTRHSTVLGEYSTSAAAFADMDQRVAMHVAAGAVADALQLFVIDGDWRHVPRP